MIVLHYAGWSQANSFGSQLSCRDARERNEGTGREGELICIHELCRHRHVDYSFPLVHVW